MDKVKFLLALTLAIGAAFGAKSQTIQQFQLAR